MAWGNPNSLPIQSYMAATRRAGWCGMCQRGAHSRCSGYQRGNHGLRMACECRVCRLKNEAKAKAETEDDTNISVDITRKP